MQNNHHNINLGHKHFQVCCFETEDKQSFRCLIFGAMGIFLLGFSRRNVILVQLQVAITFLIIRPQSQDLANILGENSKKKTPWVFLLILFFILILILWKISYKIKRFQPPLREYEKKSELCNYVDIYLVSGLSSYLRSTLPVQLWMEVIRGSVCTESQSGIISLCLKQLI